MLTREDSSPSAPGVTSASEILTQLRPRREVRSLGLGGMADSECGRGVSVGAELPSVPQGRLSSSGQARRQIQKVWVLTV